MTARSAHRHPRRLLALGVGLLVALPAGATAPLVLRHETRVSVDLRLVLNRPGSTGEELRATLRGTPGERLVFAREIGEGDRALAVGLVLRVQPGEEGDLCQIELESTVQPPGTRAVETRRGGELAQGRVWLADLWSDANTGERLVLAAVVNWEEIPRLEIQDPLRIPVDFLVGVYHKTDRRLVLLERHRLSSIVGSPVEYVYRHRPGPAEDGDGGTLAISILPLELAGDNLSLRISVSHRGRSVYSSSERMALSVTELLPPGASVDLPLPRREDAPQLVLRITPYF
ncbi:MAG: hypothetical protein Q9Q40_14805 [Acidobacteriota bacterium]|nr:hypothetical protein [Acidobacteriota bacterium]